MYKYFSLLLLIVGLMSCEKEPVNQAYSLELPAHFPAPHYQFEGNEVTTAGVTLGRQLFYDPILSSDNTISCGTCHSPTHYFADHNVAVSTGVDGLVGTRNSPAIFNMIWSSSFMWDGGVNHITVSGLPALTSPVEMNEDVANVVQKLREDEAYGVLFENAFGTKEIDDQKMFFAITQFMSTLISANSKYDQFIKGEIEFNEMETKGLQVFRQHCESCHQEPLFTDYSFRNNGLSSTFEDVGRYLITLDEADMGKFKVPTLRNILETYPYMHDGSVYSIYDVFDHYKNGIQQSETLDPLLSNGIPLSDEDKSNLYQFLKTLTDKEFMLNDEIYEP